MEQVQYSFYNRLPERKHSQLYDQDGSQSIADNSSLEEPDFYKDDLQDVLRFVMTWIIAGRTAATIGGRGLLLARLLNLDHRLNDNFASIADAAGCTRESIRQAARELENFAGLRCDLNRKDSTRENCRRSRIASVNASNA